MKHNLSNIATGSRLCGLLGMTIRQNRLSFPGSWKWKHTSITILDEVNRRNSVHARMGMAIFKDGARYRATKESLDSMFVQPVEFLRLLLSRRELIRSDDLSGDVRGLLDVRTGQRFLVRKEKLRRAQ